MIYSSEDMQTRAVLDTAARMCAAARTAPKTRGMDGLVTCVVTGEDKDRLAAHMRELAGRLDYAFLPVTPTMWTTRMPLSSLAWRNSAAG